jgi:hypothetical protein
MWVYRERNQKLTLPILLLSTKVRQIKELLFNLCNLFLLLALYICKKNLPLALPVHYENTSSDKLPCLPHMTHIYAAKHLPKKWLNIIVKLSSSDKYLNRNEQKFRARILQAVTI